VGISVCYCSWSSWVCVDLLVSAVHNASPSRFLQCRPNVRHCRRSCFVDKLDLSQSIFFRILMLKLYFSLIVLWVLQCVLSFILSQCSICNIFSFRPILISIHRVQCSRQTETATQIHKKGPVRTIGQCCYHLIPCVMATVCDIHRVPKKGDTKLMAVALLILNRFSNFLLSESLVNLQQSIY